MRRHIREGSAWREGGWAMVPSRPKAKDPARRDAASRAQQPHLSAIGESRRWHRLPDDKLPRSKSRIDLGPVGCRYDDGGLSDVTRPGKNRKKWYVAHQCRMNPHGFVPDGCVRSIFLPRFARAETPFMRARQRRV